MGAAACVALLVVYLAPMAQSEPVESGQALGAGWAVNTGGVIEGSTLVPQAIANVPVPCPDAPALCEEHDSESLVDADLLTGTVTAGVINSEAHAFKDPDVSGSAEVAAELDDAMDEHSAIALPDTWNLRGYGSVANFSALGGAITADLIEAESVSGLRDVGGTPTSVMASAARVEELFVGGIEIDVPLTMGPNTEIHNAGGIRIIYWETNWDLDDGTTTDGQPVYVNTLRIISTVPLASFDIIVGRAVATGATFEAPPPANVPPDAVDDDGTTEEGTEVVIDVTDNDTDSDGTIDDTSVTITDGPDNGTVNCVDNSCTYDPDPGFVGTDTFTYEVCDDDGDCDTAIVRVTVTAANEPPIAQDDSASTDQDTDVTIDVTANDTDSDGTIDDTSVTITDPPDNGDVICTDNNCTYDPGPLFVGTDNFTYEVCDDDGDCDTATVTVAVIDPAGPNNPPLAADDSASTDEGDPVVITVLSNDIDPDGDTITVTSATNGTNGTTTVNGDGTVTYTPAGGFTGIDTFTYTVCDDDGTPLCDTATVTVTIAGPGNLRPIANDDSATTTQDNAVPIDVTANDTDADGTIDDTSVTVTDQPNNGTVICADNICTYTPGAGFTGTDTFEYRVCDDEGACDRAIVTVTVSAGGGGGGGGGVQPPVAVDDTETAQPGQPVTVSVTDNDSGTLDPSTVTIVDAPANGTVDCANNGSCTYTPDDGFTGTDDFTYEVCNGAGQCDQASVTITVPAVVPGTSPPVARDDDASTGRGTPVPITVIQNDSDPDGDLDTSSVRVVQPPSNGTVTCIGGLCTYAPDPGFTGTDDFTYEVCDAAGNCDTAVVTIVVGEDGDGEPGGSFGEGGSSGEGPNGVPGEGAGGPDRDGEPSRPSRFSPAPAPASETPEIGLNPTLGAPRNPALPMTGGEPGFYLAVAFNLVFVGGLLLFLDGRSRRAAPVNAPARLGGGTANREAR